MVCCARANNRLGLRNIHQREEDGRVYYTVDIQRRRFPGGRDDPFSLIFRRVKTFSDLQEAILWRNEQRRALRLEAVIA